VRTLRIGMFSFLTLVVAAPLAAAELKGQVFRGNGAPAANVTVSLSGPNGETSAKTNGSGFYRFNIAPGDYTLTVGDVRERVTVPPQGTERNFRVQ
jgi:hypothetical protein